MTHVMLLGNPNCGKTTLFNALTGESERVGHWAGVTVEKKTGFFTDGQHTIQITDLPGVYTLSIDSESAPDAKVTANQVIWGDADLFVNVIDACHLERHLYLTSQLLELGKPVVIALNMMDIAERQGIRIDMDGLSRELQCPVIAIQAHRAFGIETLLKKIQTDNHQQSPLLLPLPKNLEQHLHQIETSLRHQVEIPASIIPFLARRTVEEAATHLFVPSMYGNGSIELLDQVPTDFDMIMADARYQTIHQIVASVQKKSSDVATHWTSRIDKIILHRFFAIPIFLTLLYAVFFLAIQVGGVFQTFFDLATEALFVQGSAWVLHQLQAPPWLTILLSSGVGKGLNTTMTFIPVMAIMFFLLSFMETSGYMARAAFVMDKLMRILGLPGKALIPMIIGFGCNVPAVMAARTLENEKERMLTVLMSPFMSCSARLSIYAVFVAAFFPTHGAYIVLSLYLIGILMAVLTGFLLRHTLLKGEYSPLILELPNYHRPSWRSLWRNTSRRLRQFILRAGKLIVPVCMLLSGLNAWVITTSSTEHLSVLAYIGQSLTPFFAPMGIQQDNWPAVVGLLTGTLAKEVVIGSLSSLYTQLNHVALANDMLDLNVWHTLQMAFWSIPNHLLGLVTSTAQASAKVLVSPSTNGAIVAHFGGKVAAYAYLLFVLLYMPCVSTVAAIKQETELKYMWFSIGWSFFLAYTTSVLFYQIASRSWHWVHLLWVIVITLLGLSVRFLYYFSHRRQDAIRAS